MNIIIVHHLSDIVVVLINYSIRKEKLYELVLENMKNKFHNEKINKLNAIIIDKLIDKIFVYDKNKIEIIYKNEDK